MSNGDWRTPAAYLSLGLVSVIVFSWLAWDLSSDLTEQRIRTEQSTQSHIEYAEDRIDEECLSLQGVALRDCIHEQIESARDHYRAEQDLDAQQDMAFFTKVMGYTAFIGLFLGIGSVALIFFTLRATQEMARDTRQIGESQVRAYLTAESLETEWSKRGDPDVLRLSIKNVGQSPAQIQWIDAKIVVTNVSNLKSVWGKKFYFEFGSVAPNQIRTETLALDKGRLRYFDDLNRSHDRIIEVFGTLNYLDVFRKERIVSFKFEVGVDEKTPRTWNRGAYGNQSD